MSLLFSVGSSVSMFCYLNITPSEFSHVGSAVLKLKNAISAFFLTRFCDGSGHFSRGSGRVG